VVKTKKKYIYKIKGPIWKGKKKIKNQSVTNK
jgi:hypothetical protein